MAVVPLSTTPSASFGLGLVPVSPAQLRNGARKKTDWRFSISRSLASVEIGRRSRYSVPIPFGNFCSAMKRLIIHM